MVLKRRRRFNFGVGGGKARLHLRRTFSNIFLTLTDLSSNVVKCYTSGSQVLLAVRGVKSRL